MKSILATVVAFVASAIFLIAPPAMAEGNPAAGAQVFAANCAACHIGGGNAVNPAKTLKQADLTKYGKDTPEAVIMQVTNGNGAMPRFGGRLTPTQIENVAAYVLAQADKGW